METREHSSSPRSEERMMKSLSGHHGNRDSLLVQIPSALTNRRVFRDEGARGSEMIFHFHLSNRLTQMRLPQPQAHSTPWGQKPGDGTPTSALASSDSSCILRLVLLILPVYYPLLSTALLTTAGAPWILGGGGVTKWSPGSVCRRQETLKHLALFSLWL